MKKTERFKPSIEKIKETTSRSSLAILLSVFVFGVILSALMIASLGAWLLTRFGVMVDLEGELQLGSVILFMTVISLIIGFTITYFSSKIPLKPINLLINKMNRLAAGDFKTRLKFGRSLSTHPAAQELTESFNKMAQELESTELLRNDFINSFSHEFKTPIVSIMGFANLIEKGNLTDDQRRQYAKSIREESFRLSSMATNMLNLTKIESQTILTDVISFNLSEQIRSSVLLLEDKWSKMEIDLQLDFEEHIIEANEELLKQVWINLFDNAVKFAGDRGTVWLEIFDSGSKLTVKFRNTGEGIPEDKISKIFNKFYQVDDSRATHGNGIGLAVVKRIVELHGGEIFVTSGGGVTEFCVILPKKQIRIKSNKK